MKLREVRQFGDGCTANKWSSWDLYLHLLYSKVYAFNQNAKIWGRLPVPQGREENGNSEGNPRGLCKEMALEAVELKAETFKRNEKLTLRHSGKQLYTEQWV